MPARHDLPAILARLDAWLAVHRPHFLAALRPGATSAQLAQLEKKIGLTLPADLRTLLGWHDGQRDEYVIKFEQDMRLMSCDEIAVAKRELDNEAAAARWNKSWIPFLDDDNELYRCVDASAASHAVHVWGGPMDDEVVPPEAPSLAAWLAEFVTAVEKGRYVEDPERGTFMPR